MKVVIALDSFKGTLSSSQACEIVVDALRDKIKDVEYIIKPMADGGEGTTQAMIKAAKGQWIPKTVTGSLPDMQVEAGFAWFDDNKTALVEMATASGIELLKPDQLNPMKTTTYGTGELIKAALEHGAKKILLAVGGSATVDGGTGAASALGWRFLDNTGQPVPLGGAGLADIKKIERPIGLNLPVVEVLCDCDNPLCGQHGAARVYGPQKGATAEMVEQLEAGLSHLAYIARDQLQKEIRDVPGAGAAGGLAAGAIAFMNASLVSGIEAIMKQSRLADAMQGADWVITGEGSFDSQSLQGKVVSGICRLAKDKGVKVAVVAGQVKVGKKECQAFGISESVACMTADMSLDYAIENNVELLIEATRKLANKITAN